MGSGSETARAAVAALRAKGEKVGVIQVRLYRPFSVSHLLAALPATVRGIAVLDRTKEPGGTGEPLFQDVVTALAGAVADGDRAMMPRGDRAVVMACHRRISPPAMAKAALDELKAPKPLNGFTVGINDDVSHTSLTIDETFMIEKDDVTRAVFYGLGADGTVGANKNSVKIIAEDAGLYAQGYFVYDSHKSGAQTISHLPLRSPTDPRTVSDRPGELRRMPSVRRTRTAGFAAGCRAGCHAAGERAVPYRRGVGSSAAPGAADDHRQEASFVRDRTPARWRARSGLGARTNTVLQTCFFAISGVLPRDKAIGHIKESIGKCLCAKRSIGCR